MQTILTPASLWEGFSEEAEFRPEIIKAEDGYVRYVFSALNAPEGDVRIAADFYRPSFTCKNTVLIAGEFDRRVQEELIEKFLSKNFNVFVPDYTGIWENTATVYPPAYEYGFFAKGKEHLAKVCPTAKETSYYLYAAVIRRAISFLSSVAGKTDVILAGIKSGVEIALQVAGTDKRLCGLVCIGAAGYREYVNVPKYASEEELVIDDDMMSWLTGVSGTSYAKHVSVPVMIALGSNGTISDIDRVSNLMSVMASDDVRLTVDAGLRDNIGPESLETVLQWMEGTFLGSTPPELPVVKIEVNSEGQLYALIKADNSLKIASARIYFSMGDNNHTTRAWDFVGAEYAGKDEYLANIKVTEGEDTIFVYPEIEYVNGLSLDGVVNFLDLKELKIKRVKRLNNPIVFQYPEENGFTELNDDAVILRSSLCEGVLPVGLKGLYCASGGMITYSVGKKKGFNADRILQIDTYSAAKKYNLTLVLAVRKDQHMTEYTLTRTVESSDTFTSLHFTPSDFKDVLFRPLESWEGIKSLTVCESNIVIGKILFI